MADFMEEGAKKFAAGNFAAAAVDFENACTVDCTIKIDDAECTVSHWKSVRGLYNAALAYFKADAIPQALNVINKALQIDPHQPLILLLKGNVLCRNKQFQEAADVFGTLAGVCSSWPTSSNDPCHGAFVVQIAENTEEGVLDCTMMIWGTTKPDDKRFLIRFFDAQVRSNASLTERICLLFLF